MMDQSQMLSRNHPLWPPLAAPPRRRNNWKRKHCHVSNWRRRFSDRFGAPLAPRNTTSFIIRAKRSGGIGVSPPCGVSPAVIATPQVYSPAREVVVDMAKEEWGVDGYGSMNGLIRLRSMGQDDEQEGEGEIGGESSESEIEDHIEMERRLDHDLSRFEMIYPSSLHEQHSISRFDDQNNHISQLKMENITLRERLFVLERELENLRRRVHCLENNDEASKNDTCSANNSCINGD